MRFLSVLLVLACSTQAATLAGASPDTISQDASGALAVKVASDGALVRLATKGFPGTPKFHSEGPVQWLPLKVTGAEAACVSFGVEDGQGQVKFVGALLVKAGTDWRIATEWLAECGPLGELSFKREKQSFSSPETGTLLRKARKHKSEGHSFTLDCGCNVCQSATFDYAENETWVWNAEAKTFERKLFERAYIVQYGEGLMAVARKALNDARLMSRLYRLNPDIKPGGMLKEGQQVVFERIIGDGKPKAEGAK